MLATNSHTEPKHFDGSDPAYGLHSHHRKQQHLVKDTGSFQQPSAKQEGFLLPLQELRKMAQVANSFAQGHSANLISSKGRFRTHISSDRLLPNPTVSGPDGSRVHAASGESSGACLVCVSGRVLGEVNRSLTEITKTEVITPQAIPRLEPIYRPRIF